MAIITHKWYNKSVPLYNEHISCKLTDREAKRLIKKLAKHYKVEAPIIKFNGHINSDCGYAKYWDDDDPNRQTSELHLAHDPSLSLLCHEMAHVITKRGHCQSWYEAFEKMLNYAAKKVKFD